MKFSPVQLTFLRISALQPIGFLVVLLLPVLLFLVWLVSGLLILLAPALDSLLINALRNGLSGLLSRTIGESCNAKNLALSYDIASLVGFPGPQGLIDLLLSLVSALLGGLGLDDLVGSLGEILGGGLGGILGGLG